MVAKFKNLNLAEKFSEKTEKKTTIVMGCDRLYWVVTMSKMESLLKQGYEVI